jgi:UDP-N-acetylmuramoyl-tripeptide--D-alanyl-D-alanine ligase
LIELTLAEVASAVNGQIYRGEPSSVVSGLSSTDSREISSGDIFFAKLGANDNGHRFLAEVSSMGAALAVVSEPSDSAKIDQIVVEDTVEALSALAADVLARVRSRSSLTVIGITGSNGKTSTKNMLAEILKPVAPTVAPKGSYNNKVGLPTTVLRIDFDTRYLVLEYGAAGPGSISKLAEWSKPDFSVILKVGLAHAGVFGGIEETAKIKAELVQHTSKHVVLNFDDPIVRDYRPAAGVSFSGFGFDSSANTRITDTEISLEGTVVNLQIGKSDSEVLRLNILGEHQAMNAAAALEVSELLGLDRVQSFEALEKMELAERWRMQLTKTLEDVYVINDAYNASPDSMRAALQTLATIGRRGHRTLAVLGSMAELGEISDQEHRSLGLLLVRYNIDKLIVVGQDAKILHLSATAEGSWDGESAFYGSVEAALPAIRGMLLPGDVVLVKSSNVSGLRFLGDDLAGVT